MSPRLAALTLLLPLTTAALARPPVPATKGHDLRGPALKTGLVLTVKTTSVTRDAEVAIANPDGTATKSKVTTKMTHEMRYELLAVEGRTATKQRVTFVSMKSTSGIGGQEVEVPTPAVNKVFLCEKSGGAWKVTVEKGKDDGIKALPEAVMPWTPGDDLYPEHRVKVGDSWQVGQKAVEAAFAASAQMTGVKGTVKGRLRALEKHAGELCAVVDFDITIKGEVKTAGATPMTTSSTAKITAYRSLASGITLKTTSVADSTTSFGAGAAITVKGKEKSEAVTTVKGR